LCRGNDEFFSVALGFANTLFRCRISTSYLDRLLRYGIAMSPFPNATPPFVRAMLTPCIGVCTLSPSGMCDGCLRTGEEIGRWTTMSDDERQHVMDVVLPEREAHLTQASAVPAP
jgi:uncharacterized protein